MELRKITNEELSEILEKHEKWLQDKEGGERADLSYVVLNNASLHNVNLDSADMHCANMSGADLSSANLRGANLRYANLRGADLRGGDLSNADLYSAGLRDANMFNADMSNADIRGADLRGANLSHANRSNVKANTSTLGYWLVCPEGKIIGYKKADNCIVKLLIPETAKRSNATTDKCRCSEAKVLSITDAGDIAQDSVESDYDKNFIYRVGETVSVPNFDEDRWNECSTGIHFFLSREEAESYR